MLWLMPAAFAGGGDLCQLPVDARDHDAWWADTAQIALTPPPGEDWEAVVDLELRWKDGTRVAWTETTPVEAATVDHVVVAPESARQKGGVALLVAYVRYDGPEGETRSLGTGGQFVEVRTTGLVPTARRFGARMGVGLIEDVELVDLDHDEVAP